MPRAKDGSYYGEILPPERPSPSRSSMPFEPESTVNHSGDLPSVAEYVAWGGATISGVAAAAVGWFLQPIASADAVQREGFTAFIGAATALCVRYPAVRAIGGAYLTFAALGPFDREIMGDIFEGFVLVCAAGLSANIKTSRTRGLFLAAAIGGFSSYTVISREIVPLLPPPSSIPAIHNSLSP